MADDMFDIIKVLRWHTKDDRVFDSSNNTTVVTRTLVNNAADEIERLRAALGEIGYHAEGPYDENDAVELSEWLTSIHSIATKTLNQQEHP